MNWSSRDIARMIDHSLLRPELTTDDIVRGRSVARKYGVAVVGFPHGYSATATKVFEAVQAIADGAQQPDMVLHIGRLLSRDFVYVKADIKAVVDAAHTRSAAVKVVLENCYLTDELKRTACRLCEEAGADFVKTSTGFSRGGAALADLALMRQSVSEQVQMKAAGGVRDLDMALKVRQLGVTRFGATRTEAIMDEAIHRERTGGNES
jgi:deoxyribose-phosphate aldolase